MAALWDIPGRVEVSANHLGMPRVVLTRECGSQAEIYLQGANVASWRLANKSEVLYVRHDVYMEPDTPIACAPPPLLCLTEQPSGRRTAVWEGYTSELGSVTDLSPPFVSSPRMQRRHPHRLPAVRARRRQPRGAAWRP